MKVAAGFCVHTGWASLVVVANDGPACTIVERSRVALLGENDPAWAKAPYHAAAERGPALASRIVEQAKGHARKAASESLDALVVRLSDAGHEVAGCGVIVGAPMPAWTVEQILSVHVRMHQAEGALYARALADAVAQSELPLLLLVPAKDAAAEAATDRVGNLGKSLGPPWGQDQKRAAAAALRVLDPSRTSA